MNLIETDSVTIKHGEKAVGHALVESLDEKFNCEQLKELLQDKLSGIIYNIKEIVSSGHNEGNKEETEILGHFEIEDSTNKRKSDLNEKHCLEFDKIMLIEKQNPLVKKIKIVGKSIAMQKLYDDVLHYSMQQEVLTIEGEIGTGKDLIADAIHFLGSRNSKIIHKSGQIPPDKFESELYGIKGKTYTGIDHDVMGLLESYSGGTIVIDDLQHMDIDVQTRLLNVIENGAYSRLGDHAVRITKTRFIFTTNVKLEELVKKGKLLEDFYNRIHISRIIIPSLRERREDIPLLIEYFINEFNVKHNKKMKFSPDAITCICKILPENENVRTLEHYVRQILSRSKADIIKVSNLVFFSSWSGGKTTKEGLNDRQLKIMEKAKEGPVKRRACEILTGSNHSTIHNDLKELVNKGYLVKERRSYFLKEQ